MGIYGNRREVGIWRKKVNSRGKGQGSDTTMYENDIMKMLER